MSGYQINVKTIITAILVFGFIGSSEASSTATKLPSSVKQPVAAVDSGISSTSKKKQESDSFGSTAKENVVSISSFGKFHCGIGTLLQRYNRKVVDTDNYGDFVNLKGLKDLSDTTFADKVGNKYGFHLDAGCGAILDNKYYGGFELDCDFCSKSASDEIFAFDHGDGIDCNYATYVDTKGIVPGWSAKFGFVFGNNYLLFLKFGGALVRNTSHIKLVEGEDRLKVSTRKYLWRVGWGIESAICSNKNFASALRFEMDRRIGTKKKFNDEFKYTDDDNITMILKNRGHSKIKDSTIRATLVFYSK